MLDQTEIEDWAVAEMTAPTSLVVIDLRTTSLLRLSVSTDARQLMSEWTRNTVEDRVVEAAVIARVMADSDFQPWPRQR